MNENVDLPHISEQVDSMFMELIQHNNLAPLSVIAIILARMVHLAKNSGSESDFLALLDTVKGTVHNSSNIGVSKLH
jgi:hypothetical protein